MKTMIILLTVIFALNCFASDIITRNPYSESSLMNTSFSQFKIESVSIVDIPTKIETTNPIEYIGIPFYSPTKKVLESETVMQVIVNYKDPSEVSLGDFQTITYETGSTSFNLKLNRVSRESIETIKKLSKSRKNRKKLKKLARELFAVSTETIEREITKTGYRNCPDWNMDSFCVEGEYTYITTEAADRKMLLVKKSMKNY